MRSDRSTTQAQIVPDAGLSRWSNLAAAITLTCLVGLVFFPILGFEFVDIDVGQQVVDNPHIRGLTGENLKHIFTSRCIYSYYPIRTLTFAVDYQIWGPNPTGFKLTNGLIHLGNVWLVFWLIIRMFRLPSAGQALHCTWRDVVVATFSTALFAVHPLVVEPVTWVAGREELLMTLGALGCIHFHITARRAGQNGQKKRIAVAAHVLATLCCGLACLSNAVAAVIPALIVAWDVLTPNRPKLSRIFFGTAAMWAVSAATIVAKKLGTDPEGVAVEPGIFSAEWVTLILNAYWVNLHTLAWPTKLAVSHSPLRPENILGMEVILGGLALTLTCLIFWYLRRRKLILLGLAWFGIALAPASQIMSHHVHHADRFLYLPLAGLVTGVAVALRPAALDTVGRVRIVGLIATICLFTGLLVTLSAGQVQTWQNGISMWEHCLFLDPDNATAHDSFGNLLKNRGQLERAAYHFKLAEELDANNPEMLHVVGRQMANFKDERMRNYPEAVRRSKLACELSRWENPRYVHGLAEVYVLYAQSLMDRGEFHQAIENFVNAVKVDPNFKEALIGLALILAVCPEEELRRPSEAIRIAERANSLTKHPAAKDLVVLAEIYAAGDKFDRAITLAEEARQLAQAAGERELADNIRGRLNRYRNLASKGPSP